MIESLILKANTVNIKALNFRTRKTIETFEKRAPGKYNKVSCFENGKGLKASVAHCSLPKLPLSAHPYQLSR